MNPETKETIEKARKEALKRYAPLISIFSGEIGPQAMELLEEEFIYQPTYQRGDSHHSAFLEGQRSLVLWLRDVVSRHGENDET